MFGTPDYSEKGGAINPVVSYDPMAVKIVPTNGYSVVYQLKSYDDDARSDNMVARMIKSLEFIITQSGGRLIKEVF